MVKSKDFLSAGDTLHCIELNSGKNQTGIFQYNSAGYSVRLVSYDGNPAFDFEKHETTKGPNHFYLGTERNQVITLIDSIRGNSSKFPISTFGKQPIENITFQSSIAIIGEEKWNPSDRIQEVSFTVDGTMEMLENRDHWRLLHRALEGKHPFNNLLQMDLPNYKLTLNYSGTIKGLSGRLENLHPVFTLNFKIPAKASDYIKHIKDISSFLSFALGRPLTPSRICLESGPIDFGLRA